MQNITSNIPFPLYKMGYMKNGRKYLLIVNECDKIDKVLGQKRDNTAFDK